MRYSQRQFDDELNILLEQARQRGQTGLRVVSGKLHRRVVGDSVDNRMSMACSAMWKLHRKTGGKVIHTTPSGRSSTIEIEFPLTSQENAAATANEAADNAGMTLVVDLDGTLVRTDMGVESFRSALAGDRTSPFVALGVLLRRGWPAMKARLWDMADIDIAKLPYDPAVIAYVEDWRARGGKTALVTASNEHIARAVADHLGIFDEAHGSDERHNLKGERKATFLEQRFKAGFAYMGDAAVDVAVWRKAQKAIVVNATPAVRAGARTVAGDTESIGERKGGLRAWLDAVRLFGLLVR